MDYIDVLKSLHEDSLNGHFGLEAKSDARKYENLHGMQAIIETVNDLCGNLDPAFQSGFDQIANMVITTYKCVNKVDARTATAFMNSINRDFPGTHDTALALNTNNLLRAAMAFKQSGHSGSVLTVQRASMDLFLEYNEFINKILGYLLICWRLHLGKSFNTDVFYEAFGHKLNQLELLHNTSNGPFTYLLQIAKKGPRNGVAHGRNWFDLPAQKVYFRTEQKQGGKVSGVKTEEMTMKDFIFLCAEGAEMCRAYIVGLGVVAVMDHGNEQDKQRIPKRFYSEYIRAL